MEAAKGRLDVGVLLCELSLLKRRALRFGLAVDTAATFRDDEWRERQTVGRV